MEDKIEVLIEDLMGILYTNSIVVRNEDDEEFDMIPSEKFEDVVETILYNFDISPKK